MKLFIPSRFAGASEYFRDQFFTDSPLSFLFLQRQSLKLRRAECEMRESLSLVSYAREFLPFARHFTWNIQEDFSSPSRYSTPGVGWRETNRLRGCTGKWYNEPRESQLRFDQRNLIIIHCSAGLNLLIINQIRSFPWEVLWPRFSFIIRNMKMNRHDRTI